MYTRRYSMTVVCLRFAPVWFEEMNPFTQLCVAGAYTPEINVDKIWAYVSSLDAADAIRLALESELPTLSVMNIGAGEVCSDGLTSMDLVARFYPDVTDKRNADLFSREPFAPLWSIDRAKDLLGYSPRVSWRDFAGRLSANVLEAARSGEVGAVRQEIYGHPEAHRRG
jgi:nucleoside-diphosphate-sugar epimerase